MELTSFVCSRRRYPTFQAQVILSNRKIETFQKVNTFHLHEFLGSSRTVFAKIILLLLFRLEVDVYLNLYKKFYTDHHAKYQSNTLMVILNNLSSLHPFQNIQSW